MLWTGRSRSRVQNVLKHAHQVRNVSAAISRSASTDSQPSSLQEALHPGLRPGRFFDLLLLHQHLRGGLEALVLQQPLHQFAARIFIASAPVTSEGSRGSSVLLLDVDQQRRHINKLARGIDVRLLQVVRVLQELRRDPRHRNVVDVDVLPADQVEQQVHRAVIHLAHGDRKRRLRSSPAFSFLCR